MEGSSPLTIDGYLDLLSYGKFLVMLII
jgi:hypothetical protein